MNPISTSRKHHHYSGNGSTRFWKRVAKLPEREHAVLYTLGCLLQNTEEYVLNQLALAEAEVKPAPKRAALRDTEGRR